MPGAVIVKKGPNIQLNEGRKRIQLKVTSKGDRPIQVGRGGPLIHEHCSSFILRVDRITLSLHRNQSTTLLRPHCGIWLSPRHRCRDLGAVRTR
jgi:urease beta subunit